MKNLGLAHKYETKEKSIVFDERSSLFRSNVGDEEKKVWQHRIWEIALPTSSFHSDAPVFRFSATGGKRVGSPVEKVIGRAFASRR